MVQVVVPMKYTFLSTLAAGMLITVGLQTARAESSPVGIWLDAKGRGAIEISFCRGSKLCGRIVWIKNKREQHGCGRMLLGDVRASRGGEWDFGWIIDPDDRSKYDVALKRVSRTKLKVTGYMGSRMFSRDFYWTLAPKNLDRCDGLKPENKTAVEVAAKVPEARGPKSAPAPMRKPYVYGVQTAELDIQPPSPILAVRPASVFDEGSADRNELSAEARAAFDVLAVKAEPNGVAATLVSGPRQVVARLKTCLIHAPFATVPYACNRTD